MAVTAKFVADFSEFNRAVDQADVKLRAFDAGIGRVDKTLIQTSNTFTQLNTGLSAADKTLSAFGVNIGPEIQAIRELGEASGKTASQIGAIGTAGLALGAGLAGWQIGRMIAGFFELDDVISETTAALLGWGDVAAEEAAIKVETLSRATVIAGRNITDMSEAAKINADHVAAMAKANADAAKAAADAWKKAKAELDAWEQGQIDLADKLIGRDAVDNAIEYLGALARVHDDGLVPLKTEHENIRKALEAGMAALENLGQKGTALYRDMAAEVRALQGELLKATHLSADLLMAAVPGELGGSQDVTGGIRAEENWARQLAQDVEEMSLAVEEYHAMQTSTLSDAATGADAATEGFARWTSQVQQLGGELEDIKAFTDQHLTRLIEGLRESSRLGTGVSADLAGRQLASLEEEAMRRVWNQPMQSITVNAQGSFLDTATSQQRLGQRVGDSLVRGVR